MNPSQPPDPLLHTWSLGVEEQFYIVFPLVLALLHKRVSKQLRTVVLLTAIVSLLVSVISTIYAPASAFYLLPSRAWELMLGSMLSLGIFPMIGVTAHRNAITALGFVLILGAALFFSEATPFPGIAATVPCIGAALLIGAGQSGDSFVGRILSLPLIVFIGQISYSLYLWHWPLIVFQRTNGLLSHGHSHNVTRIVFVPLLIVVGSLSWLYVEQPFRTGKFRLGGPALFRLAATSAVIGLAMGLVFITSDGLPGRFPPKALIVEKFLNYDPAGPFRGGVCFLEDSSTQLSPACLNQDPHKKNYLLLGDSQAAALWAGLSSVFPQVRFMQATEASCKPLMGTKDIDDHHPTLSLTRLLTEAPGQKGARSCHALMDHVFDDYLPNSRIDTLVMAANWNLMTCRLYPAHSPGYNGAA